MTRRDEVRRHARHEGISDACAWLMEWGHHDAASLLNGLLCLEIVQGGSTQVDLDRESDAWARAFRAVGLPKPEREVKRCALGADPCTAKSPQCPHGTAGA